jgi:hypothetical protein
LSVEEEIFEIFFILQKKKKRRRVKCLKNEEESGINP